LHCIIESLRFQWLEIVLDVFSQTIDVTLDIITFTDSRILLSVRRHLLFKFIRVLCYSQGSLFDGVEIFNYLIRAVIREPLYNDSAELLLTRVNSTNVLDEGLRIREIGHRMNSKVKLVKIGVCQK
jgi:hypothetical protein